MVVGDVFSGIGGFSLAARWMGWETAWFAEIDPYCSAVLRKHWPDVLNLGDLTKVDWSGVERVDLMAGGFPCQDLSVAGKRKGITGERSRLWSEYARAIRALRPRWVVVENVPPLLAGGFDVVRGDLRAAGYRVARPVLMSASAVGAPHLRERLWIVAHARRLSSRRPPTAREAERPYAQLAGRGEDVAHAKRLREPQPQGLKPHKRRRIGNGGGAALSDAHQRGFAGRHQHDPRRGTRGRPECDGGWLVEPDVGRVAHGVPARVDRLRGLGNAIVPQAALHIFRAIQAADEADERRVA